MKSKIIAVDFDGTIVKHEYPKIGDLVPGAVDCLADLVRAGHRIIIWTMRHDVGLRDAIKFLGTLRSAGVEIWSFNSNSEQSSWTDSPKVFAHYYIDDAALGCPLIRGQHAKPYVDWNQVRTLLKWDGML